mmetsp:Transcript_33175/g.47997  ORF Transcript_33175/g.47997 Transcript_33175/m.47997 type:complete len:261 (+) Transcript_33175:10-792(+)
MSKGYGWQCESAIIPKSYSKPINNVDSRSLLALKALASSTSSGSRNVGLKRKSMTDQAIEHRAIKEVFRKESNTKLKSSNKIEEDLDENSEKGKEARVYSALLAKSKMYEEMLAQNSQQNIDDNGSNVIDFDRKKSAFEDKIDYGTTEAKKNIATKDVLSENEWSWSRGGSDKVFRSNKTMEEQSISSSARVKTQWDKVLGSSAKEHLAQIHLATIEEREAVQSTSTVTTTSSSSRRDAEREERLQLLRRKQSTHSGKEA